MPAINIKTEKFEGPFDLLYHLIEKNEIDIYDIPISTLADQYVNFLKTMPETDMDSMSEFILMAATLLEIKSKMLLPKVACEDSGEDEDPRSELVRRLVEYKKYKELTGFFKEREGLSDIVFYKNIDRTLPVTEIFTKPVDLDEILDGVSLDLLYKAFAEVLNRRELKTDKIRSSFKSVQKDLHTVEEKIEYIQGLLKNYESISFEAIFPNTAYKIEKIVTFLALLELIRLKSVKIYQVDLFGEIKIVGNDKNEIIGA